MLKFGQVAARSRAYNLALTRQVAARSVSGWPFCYTFDMLKFGQALKRYVVNQATI